MRFDAECVPCLLRRVLFEVDLSDVSKEELVMREAVRLIAERWGPSTISAKLATDVHAIAYELLGDEDPYRNLKDRANEVALSLLPRAEAFISSREDRFEAACLVAVAGNVMDFGIGGFEDPEEICSTFDSLVSQDLDPNDVGPFHDRLRRAKRVVYLFDNCGEIVLDRFLLQEIRAMGVEVVGVVKGKAIITDATVEDVISTGTDRFLDRVMDTGQFAIGIDLATAPEELRREIDRADLLIAKGMANLEALSDERTGPVVHILRTKCAPVASAIKARKDSNVVKLIERWPEGD